MDMGWKTFTIYLCAIVIGAMTIAFCAQKVYDFVDKPDQPVLQTSVGEDSVGDLWLHTPGTLREFPSVTALQIWLEEDNLDAYTYMEHNFDCDDFAFELQRRAFSDGYYISIQVLEGAEYGGYHITNVTKIGNTIYSIDAETDEVKAMCYID